MKQSLLLLFLAILPIMAMADDSGSCGDNVTYKYVESTKTLSISGTGPMKDFEYNTSSKSSNEPWQSYRYDIRHVVIENGVTTIGNYFLRDCTELNSITIPSSVTEVGVHAFNGCTGLTKVTIDGNGDITFGSNSFRNCSAINYYIPKGTFSAFLKVLKLGYGGTLYEMEGDKVWSETIFGVPNVFTTYYDYDGDGVMEYFGYKTEYNGNYITYTEGFFDKQGNVIAQITKKENIYYTSYRPVPPYIDYVNGKGDLMYFNEELSSDYYGRKSYDISDVVNIPSLKNVDGRLLVDVDNDGRKDLIGDYSYPIDHLLYIINRKMAPSKLWSRAQL